MNTFLPVQMKIVISLLVVLLGFSMFVPSVFAHGFGERYDLPIPLHYFLVGASATVALSFVVIGWVIRQGGTTSEYPRLNLWENFVFRVIARCFSMFVGILSVFLLVLTVVSGIYGTEDALENFSPTFVWIIWWVGIGYLVAFMGNVWAIANPWQLIFTWLEAILGVKGSPKFRWPSWLDAWPALLGFFFFVWIENVFPGASRPNSLAWIIVTYSFITWMGMLLFGKYVWLKRGDPFSVLFALFARFSPTEVRVAMGGNKNVCVICNSGCSANAGEKSDLQGCVDCYECWELADDAHKEFSIRPWAVGLSRGERVSPALVAFHITALASVTFDGFSETSGWVAIQTLLWPFVDPIPGSAIQTIESLGILLVPLLFASVYILLCGRVSRLSGDEMPEGEVIRSFVFSLVPIALAYNLSHYLSFIMISGQQIIPLVSDPLGTGLNILGTAEYVPNIGIIDARLAWIVSVTSLVAGHIVSVYVAHTISLRRTSSHIKAVKSQYPMLVLMVFYTAISLWIVAQPLVN